MGKDQVLHFYPQGETFYILERETNMILKSEKGFFMFERFNK